MQITVEIPDALAGQLHLGAKADLRSLLQAMVEQRIAEGGLTVVHVDGVPEIRGTSKTPMTGRDALGNGIPLKSARPQRDVLARLRSIYGDMPMTGENAVLAARRLEKY